MVRSHVTILHDRSDQLWAERIRTHLASLTVAGLADISVQDDVGAGTDWRRELAAILDRADILIVLVSADFIASDLASAQLPRLIQRAQSGDIAIVPVIARPCDWVQLPWLATRQVFPQDGRPLSDIPNADMSLVQIAKHVRGIAEAYCAETQQPDLGRRERPGIQRSGVTTPRMDSRRSHVFICHDAFDGDFAELLKLRLDKEGYAGWIDADRLRPGEDWRLEIDEAIRTALAVIVIVTPEAKSSEYVTYEWSFAWGAGKKVIPLLLRATQLHPRLDALQYIDFTNRRGRPWQRLFEELVDTVNRLAAG